MIKVNDVIEQAEDENMYVVTEIIDDNIFCLQIDVEGKTMEKMAVIDINAATKVTPPEPILVEDNDPQMVAVGDEYDDFDEEETQDA
ncbi:hypothetical protein LCGC14_1162550 [marine sediment metagenome]|uniref:Uncharacterized protein n=1 Tax=marine sediment metagenome TaxID=412755 RepID=A0A0F9MF88_9ZZZZ